MRADQPVRRAASLTVIPSTAGYLTRSVSRYAGSLLPAVAILEPDDVVDLRRRHLEDRRVLQRRDAMNGAGPEVERAAGPDDLGLGDRLTRGCELELGTSGFDVPGLVLDAVELEAERVTRSDEDELADVAIGQRPEQLMAPRLLDPLGLEGEAVDAAQVRGGEVPLHANRRVYSARRCRRPRTHAIRTTAACWARATDRRREARPGARPRVRHPRRRSRRLSPPRRRAGFVRRRSAGFASRHVCHLKAASGARSTR